VIVVDCSAVVHVLAGMPDGEELQIALRHQDLHAPALLDVELVSALRAMTRTGRLSVARALDVLTDFEDLPVQRWFPGDALRRRMFSLRDTVSAYDAAYVALAESLQCALVTRDARLACSTGHDATIVVR
jgi:predicted nucleic acid-binding protein